MKNSLCLLLIGFVIGVWIAVIHCENPWEPSPKEEEWWMKRHQKYLNFTATRAKDVKILFIGSSSCEYWGTTAKDLWDTKYAPLGAVNYGIRGDATQHVLWRIEQGELDGMSPKLVVIYIGSNNVPRNEEEDVVRGVDTVISKLHEKLPNANLLFVAFFPRANRRQWKKILRKVRNITEELEPIIKGDTERKAHFIDMFWSFAPRSLDGIYEQYFREDKLHLNRDGYAIWDNQMNNTFYQLLND